MNTKFEISFAGVAGYEAVRRALSALILHVTKDDKEMRLYLAINEAVNNAIRYGKNGIKQTKVKICGRLSKRYIAITVCSETCGFDVNEYIEKLREITSTMQGDWADFFFYSSRGRGIWVILSGTEKVYYNSSGTAVTMITRIPVKPALDSRGQELLNKLYIRGD